MKTALEPCKLWKIGSKVALKSGGPEMTVVEHVFSLDGVVAEWVDTEENPPIKCSAEFHSAQLKAV